MGIIESKQILKNLNVVPSNAKNRFEHEFILQEVTLNEEFKETFCNYLTTKKCEVEYYDKTTVVTNSAGQIIYIANQWFAIASYFVDFCTEMLTYRTLFVKICKLMYMDASKMKEYATSLKNLSTLEDKIKFKDFALKMLKNDFPGRDDEYDSVAEYLWKFVSDYNWWAGNKTVDRHDFYISALLNQMNVVNNNSEFLAIIVHSYASDLDLRVLAENVENIAIDFQINEYSLPEEHDENNGSLVSEPSIRDKSVVKSKGISISAASLERFQSKG